MSAAHQAKAAAEERCLRLPSRRALLSLPVLVAFGLFSSPARAMPGASMQLFRVDGHGVKPLPAISALMAAPTAAGAVQPGGLALAPAQAAPGNGLSPQNATAAADRAQPMLAQVNESAAGLSELRQSFVGQLPPNLSGNIRLVSIAEDGTLGQVVEEIPFSSPNISFSADRTTLIVRPSTPIPVGQSVMLQLPSRSPTGIRFVYPNHLVSTPCIFKATAVSSIPAAAAAGAAAAPAAAGAAVTAAAAASIPVWAIITGVVVLGVGVAAAAGAFTGGSGGGGTAQSSQ